MSTPHLPARRTVAKGIAWTAPALTLAAAAPSLAASPPPIVKNPGINGWVLNTTRPQPGNCAYTLEVDSTPAGTGPDGAPYGLYLYDVEPAAIISGATLTYWIIGSHPATGTGRVAWATRGTNSDKWIGPVRGTPQGKDDGLTYTPYTWTYSETLLGTQVSPDGRLRFGDFHVQATFTQGGRTGAGCNDVTYWTQRAVTVDQDGSGTAADPELLTFERRNGTRGPYTGGGRSAQAPADAGVTSLPS